MTTLADLSRWFDVGVAGRMTHMLVICDDFDYEDYPVYVRADQDVHKVIKEKCRPDNMQRLMEVYDLRKDKLEQLTPGKRVFNY